MAELVGVYEESPEDGGRVMELMQRMQACGTPPQEILVRFFVLFISSLLYSFVRRSGAFSIACWCGVMHR